MMMVIPFLLAAAAAAPADTATGNADAYYHYSLGHQARLSGDLSTALDEYRRALKLDPRAGAIHSDMARALAESGRVDEAVGEARLAVDLAPNEPDVRLMLAKTYELQARTRGGDAALRKAIVEYERVVALAPADGQTLWVLGTLYSQQGEHKDAARTWRKFVDLDPASFDAWVQLGKELLAQDDAAGAADALRKALAVDPNSARAYQSLAELYAQKGETDQAVLHYRKALQLDPAGLRTRLALGEVLLRANRAQEAANEADAVLLTDAHNRFALELKGRALRDLKRFDEASVLADKALVEDPRDLKTAYLKVTIAEGRRDFKAAAAALEAILARGHGDESGPEASSNDRVFLVHLGFAYQQLGRFADAAEAFGRAVALGTDADASLVSHRIEALTLARDLPKALVEVRAARVRFPKDVDLANDEAEVLRLQGDVDGAVRVLEALRRERPDDPAVLLALADLDQRAKRYQDAVAVLQRVRELQPGDMRALFQAGAALERLKRHDEAEALFRDALKVDPNAAPVLNYLGYMNADRGVRMEEAVGLIEKALAQDPENGAYLDSLGWALFRLDRLERAEATLRKALSKENRIPSAVMLDHLGDVLKRRGRVPEAIDYWNRALKGEDESGELDRPTVERKIREAQASLDAHNQKP
jgi:tetratricopeptide (TPR) repeat protein